MSERPLDQVLTHAWGDFTPEHPSEDPPWHQPTLKSVELAYTGNLATVNLAVADRVQLHGLDRPSYEQDWECPEDWTRQSWGVAPYAYGGTHRVAPYASPHRATDRQRRSRSPVSRQRRPRS